jgi:hypothetical protein
VTTLVSNHNNAWTIGPLVLSCKPCEVSGSAIGLEEGLLFVGLVDLEGHDESEGVSGGKEWDQLAPMQAAVAARAGGVDCAIKQATALAQTDACIRSCSTLPSVPQSWANSWTRTDRKDSIDTRERRETLIFPVEA